jgi:hypothetical protein
MKTFADIKRRFVVGMIIECVENTYRPAAKGRRRIEKVQTNAIACTLLDNHPDALAKPGQLFWTEFPPAKNVTVVDHDTFQLRLWKQPEHHVTFRFLGGSAGAER